MTLKNAFENLAVESKQDAILTELEKKADVTETQPVEVQNQIDISGVAKESKQLPDNHRVTISNPTADPETGLSKDVTSQAILNELELKADLTETQPVNVENQVDISGLATSSKQLPDNHNVTVSNLSGLATEAKQDDTITALENMTVTANVDLTQIDRTNYMFYDDAEDTNYDYVAKQSAAGNWYIARYPKTGVNDITKYAVGNSNLATAWASFASQSYADWDTNNSPTSSGVISMAGMATEAKQDSQITELQSLNSKDFSTETTLQALSDKLDILLAKPIETIDTVHDHIHEGNSFTTFETVSLAVGASYTIIINTNDTLRKHSFLQAYLAEELEAIVYEGVTTTSDGTAIQILNRNRNSTNTSTAALSHIPTGLSTTGSTIVRHARVGSKNAFGDTQQTNELILKANTKYAVTFTNRGNNTAYLNWQWFWYECGDCE